MRDDIPASLHTFTPSGVSSAASGGSSATIIPFPARRPRAVAAVPAGDALYASILAGMDAKARAHPATVLAALGALNGFAIQQALMLAGGSGWAQPLRAERLDRALLSLQPADASLWHALVRAADGVGAHHLPDPQKLLAATLKCMGTTQFGLVTLPLEYRLEAQPQTSLVQLWARLRATFDEAQVPPSAWAAALAALCAGRVVADRRQVPPHVALRIVMQAALAMALVEPKLIPGAALKAE
jgi:hypothetical protein